MTITGSAGVSMPTARPLMMLVAGPVSRGLGDRLHRAEARLRVVLGDADEQEGRDDAADAAAPAATSAPLQHEIDGDREADQRQQGSDVVAAVERVHRVFVFAAVNDAHADDARDRVDGLHDQREEDALDAEDGIERRAQDHRADVFRGGGLEDVRAAARAVADVVADQVGDHGRVARIVFGDAGLDLADQVRADVGGLGVNAAAQLREQCHQRRAEAESYQLVGNLLRIMEPAEDAETAARRRAGRAPRPPDPVTAPPRSAILQRLSDARARRRADSDIGADRDAHAAVAGQRRASRADDEADHDLVRQRSGE